MMLPKSHLTSHSRMSGSRWVITPSWLSGSWKSFLYSSSVYSCHLFLISSASVRSLPFLSPSLWEKSGTGLVFLWLTLYWFGACLCAQSLNSVWLCNPMDCSLPDSSAHGIFQARVLEWVAISSSRGSYWPKDETCVSGIGRHILYHWATWELINKTVTVFPFWFHGLWIPHYSALPSCLETFKKTSVNDYLNCRWTWNVLITGLVAGIYSY